MNTKFLMTEHSFGWWLLLGCWVSILSWSASAWAVNNMSIMASNRLISRNMTQRYTGQSTFTDNQGDWSVTSNLVTDYTPKLELIPNLEKAQFSISVVGSIKASSIIKTDDEAKIYTTSTTSVSGRKSIFVDRSGLIASPAKSAATTLVDIYDVKVPPFFPFTWLVLDHAWSMAEEAKPEMEAAASRMAADKTNAAMDQMVLDQQQKIDPHGLFSWISNSAVRERLVQQLSFSTTSERMLMEGDFQFGAPMPLEIRARAFRPRTDFGVQINQNALNGVAKILGGSVVTGEDVVQWFGLNPETYTTEANINTLRATFAQKNPLVVTLSSNAAVVTLSFSELSLNGNDLGAVTIKVAYDVSLTDGRINLDLVDDLRVMRTEGEPSPGDLPIAATMCDDAMKLLKNVFHKNMTFSTLEDLKIVTVADTLLAGKLVFSDVSLADGWLNVGMSIP